MSGCESENERHLLGRKRITLDKWDSLGNPSLLLSPARSYRLELNGCWDAAPHIEQQIVFTNSFRVSIQ